MDALLESIAPHWFKEPPATEEQLAATERAVGRVFPASHRAFIAWSNGGEGNIGGNYFSLWPLSEIEGLNEAYQIARYLPGFLAIGSDGGDFCYALDYREHPDKPPLVIVEFGDLDPASVRVVGGTFRRGIETLLGVTPDS